MKNITVLCFVLLMPLVLGAQSAYIECPDVMPKDTVYTATRVTRDFYFNSKNTADWGSQFRGNVDVNLYATLESSVAGGDTVIVDAYGLTLIRREGNVHAVTGVGTVTVVASDSLRIGTFVADTALHVYPLDAYWDLMKMYDGVRLAIKKNGTDLDSTNVWSNLKIWKDRIRTGRSAFWETMAYDTATVTTAWDTLALGATYERFQVMCEVDSAFYVSFTADTLDAVRMRPGEILPMDVEADTLVWKLEAGSALMTVDMYRRKY